MIEIKNLTKKYGETVILEQAEYRSPQKGIVCLMGASGGGKTTLFNLLAGFDTGYEGEITVGGTCITGMDADALCAYRRDNIGFVFQNYHLLTGYTVLENVMLASALSENSAELALQRAKALLQRLGLSEKAEQRVETLSGGQKQRVAIARALMGDPQIIFADEPTGALDRKNATEIMELLREISVDKLVVVITHDAKITAFADELIHISGRKIITEQEAPRITEPSKPLLVDKPAKFRPLSRSVKNFKVHIKRYVAVSLAISVGLLAFLFSLSFGNVMEQSILAFQEKNTAFNSGYIKGADDGTVLAALKADGRLQNVYYQYKLTGISLLIGEKTIEMAEKFPGSKATESLSYGVMPRQGKNEIAITPSLAKKLDDNIQALIGKELTLRHNGQEYALTISGIFNAGYDDFFVSSDVEQLFYEGITGQENDSISFEVKAFSDIVAVSNSLKSDGLEVKTAADEVEALQKTFQSLNTLFFIISLLVLAIGLFICTILLFKLQNSRYHEVGLLSALGFGKRQISAMITVENGLLSALATVITFVLLIGIGLLSNVLKLPFIVDGAQVLLAVVASFAIVMVLSGLASDRLLRTEPAQALRK